MNVHTNFKVPSINMQWVRGKNYLKLGQGQNQGHLKVIEPHQNLFHLKGFTKMYLHAKFEVPSIIGSEVMLSWNLQKYAKTNKQDKSNTLL